VTAWCDAAFSLYPSHAHTTAWTCRERVCNLQSCALNFTVGEWSECSKYCNRGLQFRSVRCIDALGRDLGIVRPCRCFTVLLVKAVVLWTCCHHVVYPVVSSHLVSCRVVSCRVVSCRVVSCRVVSCRVVSCRVVSCRVVQESCGGLVSAPPLVRFCTERPCDVLQYSRPRFSQCEAKCSSTLGRLDRIPHPQRSRNSLCLFSESLFPVDLETCSSISMDAPVDSKNCNTDSCFAKVCVCSPGIVVKAVVGCFARRHAGAIAILDVILDTGFMSVRAACMLCRVLACCAVFLQQLVLRDWDECEAECGAGGLQYRDAFCLDRDGQRGAFDECTDGDFIGDAQLYFKMKLNRVCACVPECMSCMLVKATVGVAALCAMHAAVWCHVVRLQLHLQRGVSGRQRDGPSWAVQRAGLLCLYARVPGCGLCHRVTHSLGWLQRCPRRQRVLLLGGIGRVWTVLHDRQVGRYLHSVICLLLFFSSSVPPSSFCFFWTCCYYSILVPARVTPHDRCLLSSSRRARGWVLDIYGQCCNTRLDACGICNGTGVAVDVRGMCCPYPLSASGLCCASVDDCGVCNGGSECTMNAKGFIGIWNSTLDGPNPLFDVLSLEFDMCAPLVFVQQVVARLCRREALVCERCCAVFACYSSLKTQMRTFLSAAMDFPPSALTFPNITMRDRKFPFRNFVRVNVSSVTVTRRVLAQQAAVHARRNLFLSDVPQLPQRRSLTEDVLVPAGIEFMIRNPGRQAGEIVSMMQLAALQNVSIDPYVVFGQIESYNQVGGECSRAVLLLVVRPC
jgi:hypothetical protein